MLAEAKQIAADAGNAPRLREENLQLHKENVKVQKELAKSRKALEEAEALLKALSEKDGSVIRDLENTLRDRLEEVAEMDKHLFGKLCYAFPAMFVLLAFFRVIDFIFSVFSAENSVSSRIERIRNLGEFIETMKTSGKLLVEKLIQGR